MTSAKFFNLLTPPPPVPVTVKEIVSVLVCFCGIPLPSSSADIVCTCPLRDHQYGWWALQWAASVVMRRRRKHVCLLACVKNRVIDLRHFASRLYPAGNAISALGMRTRLPDGKF